MTLMTPRERELLIAASTGLTAGEIGHRFGLSHQTVKNHLSSVYRKLDVTSLVEALRALGWIVADGDDASIAEAEWRLARVREEVAELAAAVGRIDARRQSPPGTVVLSPEAARAIESMRPSGGTGGLGDIDFDLISGRGMSKP